MTYSPFGFFKDKAEELIKEAIGRLYPEAEGFKISLEKPPSPSMGNLAFPCFNLAERLHLKPRDVAESLAKDMDSHKNPIIAKVEAAGAGYVNIHVNHEALTSLLFNSIDLLKEAYGFIKTDKPLKIIVEHTSANPIHPLHIGTARNAILGDAIARLLEQRGHKVAKHFYINDVGLQVAVASYGYMKLKGSRIMAKPDHFIGLVYTITQCLASIRSLKERIEDLKVKEPEGEDLRKLTTELDEWVSAAAEVREKAPEAFDNILKEMDKDPKPEETIAKLDKDYEQGKPEVVENVKELCNLCLKGFKETLNKASIYFDSWDWESELTTWGGQAAEVIEGLKKTQFTLNLEGALTLNSEKAAEKLRLKPLLGLREEHTIPELTLTRSDGRTLYEVRDVAYTLWKFKEADKVINVVGSDQTLPQLQVKLALYTLNHPKQAENLKHYVYEPVQLEGFKISSRRGRYVTFDYLIDEAVERAYKEVCIRSPEKLEEEKRKIAEAVGIGAVKYAFLSISSSKPMMFTWSRILDFERNSGPFIQYAHARAASILTKAGKEPAKPSPSLLKHEIEKQLILKLSELPEVFKEAADNLKPELIAENANSLAESFNIFYEHLPVLKAEPTELKEARLKLVQAFKISIKNALNILGLEAPTRI